MNSTTRLYLKVIGILLLALVAFGAGYGVRSWQLGLLPSALGRVTATDPLAEPIIRDELYQQVWTLLERDFYGDDPTLRERIYASARGLAQAYEDPYTFFVEPQPRALERDQLRGSFGGIGAYIDPSEDGYTLRPIPGQPAEQAGVQAGDRLIAIDGVDVTQETDLDAILVLVRGEVGTEVCLDLERDDPGAQTPSLLNVCIVRAEIQTPSVEWRLLEEGGGNVGYIRHSIYSERSADEMLQAIQELQDAGADRFVLDLRGNPGGLVNTAVAIADLWLDEGVVLIERKASGEDQTFRSTDGDVSQGAPLVVLVDGGTASAAEIVSGALHDRGRALLVGQKTFGKGSVQLVHDLVDQSSLHVTTARWYTPDENAIDGIGLTPDVLVEEGADPLVRAVETVQAIAAR